MLINSSKISCNYGYILGRVHIVGDDGCRQVECNSNNEAMLTIWRRILADECPRSIINQRQLIWWRLSFSLLTYWKFRAWQIGRQLWPYRNINETVGDEQGRQADAADDVAIKWETSSSERNELTGPRTVQCWWCRPVMWVNTVWQSTARLIWFAGVSFVWVWRGRFASQSRTRTRRRRAVATTVTAG